MEPDPLSEWAAREGFVVNEGAAAPTRFAFYGRVSTDDLQSPEDSLAWQRGVAESLIKGHGEIVEAYFDIGVSRSIPWSGRPEAAALLAATRADDCPFDAVVVGEASRAFMGTQVADVMPMLTNAGVSLWVPEIGGVADPKNSIHTLQLLLTGGLSEAERSRIQARVKAGMGALVTTQGRRMGGRPPYGYRLVEVGPHPNPRKASEGLKLKALEPDPLAAPVVARIFRASLEGVSARTIATNLNTDGVPCPSPVDPGRNTHRRGDGWQHGTVTAILANLTYTGRTVWGRTTKKSTLLDETNPSLGSTTKFVKADEPPAISQEQSHEPLVSVEDWLRLDSIRAANRVAGPKGAAAKPRRRKPTSALQGLVRCSLCGRKMQKDSHQGSTRLRCRPRDLVPGSMLAATHPDVRIREALLLPVVVDWLTVLFTQGNREGLLDRLVATPTSPAAQRGDVVQRRADVELKVDRLLSAVEAGMDLDLIAPRLAKARAELTALEAIPEVEAPGGTSRGALAAALDVVAQDLEALIGDGANPQTVNAFLASISLGLTWDHENATATVQIGQNAANPLQHQPEGVSGRVRGGT